MHVGWVSTFAAPEDGPRPGFDELFAFLAGRLAHAPRWRQKLAPVPLGVHEPAWVDDPDFDPAEHVLHAPGDDLDAIADEIFSTPLPRDRPLWQFWIADELADGRIAMVCKAHHCMVDGIAITELGRLILDAEPFEDRGEPEPLGPGAHPVARRALRPRRGRPRRRRRRAGARAAQARRARPGGCSASPGSPARVAHTLLPPAPGSPLNQPRLAAPPPRARHALARRPAHDPPALRRDAQRRRARRLRGRAARRSPGRQRLKVMVPADVRGAERRRQRQPHLVRVPRAAVRRAGSGRAPARDPPRDRRERGRDAEDLDAAFQALALTPSPVQRALAHAFAHPRMSNLTISSVPGPAVHALHARLPAA